MPDARSLSHDTRVAITDEMIDRAIRAAYDAYPTYTGKKGTPERRPLSYEESYGHTPLEAGADVAEMRYALDAAINSQMPVPGCGDAWMPGAASNVETGEVTAPGEPLPEAR